ncbi:hypothetical protein [Streptomyces aureus]|uniref:hypothetical protein n=1 Tax=Streptomyces aureus TaxID=193461 RepID=UPI000A9BB71F|nr:hypothetical protein [Streptomyces aureus]
MGYKTSWLAVPGASDGVVADALGLTGRVAMDWESGTETAYRRGVFVASPVDGWTFAHGRVHLGPGNDNDSPAVLDWLGSLGRQLGDFQYFCTDRIGEHHAWARVEAGRVVRAYCYDGMTGDVPMRLGEPTGIELRLGVGQRGLEECRKDWSEAQWDDWHAAMPNEQEVMAIARDWGICPLEIRDEEVVGKGIHGCPPGVD